MRHGPRPTPEVGAGPVPATSSQARMVPGASPMPWSTELGPDDHEQCVAAMDASGGGE